MTKSVIFSLSLLSLPSFSQAFEANADFAVAGCAPSDFVAVAGNTVVGISGNSYTPRCLMVKAGTQVAIAANQRHPLQGIAAPGPANPILDPAGGTSQGKVVTFNEPGVFGYFCTRHDDGDGTQMGGAIKVVP